MHEHQYRIENSVNQSAYFLIQRRTELKIYHLFVDTTHIKILDWDNISLNWRRGVSFAIHVIYDKIQSNLPITKYQFLVGYQFGPTQIDWRPRHPLWIHSVSGNLKNIFDVNGWVNLRNISDRRGTKNLHLGKRQISEELLCSRLLLSGIIQFLNWHWADCLIPGLIVWFPIRRKLKKISSKIANFCIEVFIFI